MARLIFVVVVAALVVCSSAKVVPSTPEVVNTGKVESTVILEEGTYPKIADIQNEADDEASDLFGRRCRARYIRHRTRCDLFAQCVYGIRYPWQRCPAGLLFDTRINVCNWPSRVKC